MSNSNIQNELESESPLMSVLLGILITVGLAAVSYALLPLIGRPSGFWGVLSVVPLLSVAGGALGLLQYSFVRGDWLAFSSPKLRYLMLFGLPLAMLGVANGDPALWIAGGFGIAIGLFGLSKFGGLLAGLKSSWKLLLLSMLLGGTILALWLLFGNRHQPELDEYGCLVGLQDWCEHDEKCIEPWIEHCGDGTTVDSFLILKKVRNFSGLDMSRPVQDQFTWIEDQAEELVGLYIPGLTSRIEGAELETLHQAFIKANLKPSEVNSNDIETGGLRGYRYYDIVVCSASFAESTSGAGMNIGVSCGPLAEGIPE